MRKMLILLIMAMLPALAMAAPFGLKMGMTLKEIAKECEGKPEFVKKDAYMIKPKKNHPLFDYYLIFVDTKKGLYQIKAISADINTNEYGSELRSSFNSTRSRISKKYGEPEIRDEIDPESPFQDENYWMHTLKKGARRLVAIWGKRQSLDDKLDLVILSCESEEFSTSSGYLTLVYIFKNADSVEDEQDSVF